MLLYGKRITDSTYGKGASGYIVKAFRYYSENTPSQKRIRAILEPDAIKQRRKCPFYKHFRRSVRYSNSIVAGGFPVQSYSTRFTCGTSFTMRFATLLSTGHGISAASAVMKSTVLTARSATA